MKKVARYVSAGLLLTPALSDSVAQASELDLDSSIPTDSAIAPRLADLQVATQAHSSTTQIPQPEAILLATRSAQPAATPRTLHPPSTPATQPLIPTQPLTPQTQRPGPDTSAADLQISPRLGINHTSSGGGFDGITRFEGFLPLLQTPGRDLAFLEGRLLLDNDAHIGGNLVLGYRAYSPEAQRTFGGYVAYDNRDTDHNTFDQLGLGLESLGTVWDFRANAYIPIGDRRQPTGDTQLTDTFFRERSLILRELNHYEAAVGGADVEAGVRLAELGDRGDLRGYGGLYWYDAAGGSDGLGWRLRLDARPNDSLSMGVGVQHDDLFGTNLMFRVGFNIPGSRPRHRVAPEETAIARLGESVERNPTILIDSQTEEQETIATNPDTGQPYVFQHVRVGVAGGNGTIENPYGTIQPALTATESDGNHIVYVQPGTNSGLTGFSIPDRVQVLSTAPVQRLNTTEFGTVRLPLSGTGPRPIVTNTVTAGNDTTLAGFNITGSTGPGIVASSVEDVVLRENSITSAAGAGIFLENTSGTISVTDSTVSATGAPALLATGVETVQIADSSLNSSNSSTSGIVLNGVDGEINIRDTAIAIANPAADGITLSNVTGFANIAATSGSTIANAANAGVRIQSSPGSTTISGLQITGAGTDGISGSDVGAISIQENAIAASGNNGIALTNVNGTTDISNNTIDTPGAIGINLATATGNVTLSDNTVDDATGDGINLFNVAGSATLSDNTVNSAGATGISVNNLNGSATISSNNVISAASDGINLTNAIGSTSISNNTVTNPGQDGIEVNNSSGQIDLSLAINEISGAGANGINVALSGDAGGTAQITANRVTNAALRGIAVDVSSNNTQFRSRLEQNQVTGSSSEGLAVFANGTSEILTDVRFNRLDSNNTSGTAPAGVSIVNNTAPNLCADIQNNSSTNTTEGFNVQQNVGDPQALDANIDATNVGTVTNSGTVINSVAAGACSIP